MMLIQLLLLLHLHLPTSTAAHLLEPVNHGLLHVHRVTLHVDQALAQGARVELLEDILVVQVPEKEESY